MTRLLLSPQQQQKLAEALEVAQRAEAKASQMSELATQIADKYQQHLYDLAQSAPKSSSET